MFLFCIEDAKAVIGGGVFLVKLKDSEKCLFGFEWFALADGGLSNIPKFFHLGRLVEVCFFFWLRIVVWYEKSGKEN